jgi:mono/diheme cytochrome c family protein
MRQKVWIAMPAVVGLSFLPCLLPHSLAADAGHKNPYSGDAKSVAIGRDVYAANCADCHGATGKGDGKMASDLKKKPTDLSDPDVGSLPDEGLFRQVSRAKKPMPSFEKLLSEEQRWHVVNYVRTLSGKK